MNYAKQYPFIFGHIIEKTIEFGCYLVTIQTGKHSKGLIAIAPQGSITFILDAWGGRVKPDSH